MSDLAWAKAAKLLKLDHAAGWPHSLNLQRLAVLQTGWGTKELRDEVNAIITTLLHACKVGTIDHTTKDNRVTLRPVKSVTVGTSPLMGGAKVIYTQPADFKTVTSHHIGAPAFAAWLADQGLTPSDSVSAWFKATGTAELEKQAAAAKMDRETTDARNMRWHLEFEQAKLTDSEKSRAEVARLISGREGQKLETVRKAMRAGKELHADKYKSGEVRPPNSQGSIFRLADANKKSKRRQA